MFLVNDAVVNSSASGCAGITMAEQQVNDASASEMVVQVGQAIGRPR